jgi:TatD DNase family protein
MNIIDTHSHIYLPEFDADREKMLDRAAALGVSKILMPAIDSSTHMQMLALEKSFSSSCSSMMGLHPCSVKENYADELAVVESYFDMRKFIAVGEIGLDFYWDKTFIENQYKAFHLQIELAIKYNVPIVIHSRNSTDECIEVVSQYAKRQLRGVFHCFSGNIAQAEKIIDVGFYLGIGGVVTFKNAGLDKVIEVISLDKVMLETDAPYLAPVPFRGKRNEPVYLEYVINKISALKNYTVEDVALITTTNAKKLFAL